MADKNSYYATRNRLTDEKIELLLLDLPTFCMEFIYGTSNNTSALTRLNYVYDLRIFFNYLSQIKKIEIENMKVSILDEITAFDVERFLNYLSSYQFNGKHHSCDERGKARKLSTIRALCRYFFAKDMIKSNIPAKIPTPKIHEKEIIRLEGNEVEKLLDLAESDTAFTGRKNTYHNKLKVRDFAILSLFLGTGIRISELVGLNVNDFNFTDFSFRVTRKGGDEVILYFNEEVCDALCNWLDYRCDLKDLDKNEPAMFVSMKNQRISTRAVQVLVKEYAEEITLKKITPHKLRSTFGTDLYRQTGDIYAVADFLGHKDVNTTRKHYAAISQDSRRQSAGIVQLRKIKTQIIISKIMHNNDNFKTIYEKAYLLFPIFNGRVSELESRHAELCELVKTAGAEVVGYGFQVLREISPATIFGSGKLEEMREEIREKEVNVIIFDGDLSPSQAQNLCDFFDGIKFIDRTALILDIFALNAKTKEGKLQVELAQHEYILSRLKGQGDALSRLGGGIGTRGPGETKLETDRRYIRHRITNLKEQLEELTKKRKVMSSKRSRTNTLTVALAGYTNAGKSTLLNAMSGSDVLAEDKLFATLDPTARKVKIKGFNVVLIDTVGFIKDIPTKLINAFKSTLDSVTEADLILNVCDAKGDWERQNEVTESILRDLNANSPIIKVFNKCEDICDFTNYPANAVFISAKNKIGLEKLEDAICKVFEDHFINCTLNLDFSELNEFYKIKDFLESYDIIYEEDKVKIDLCIKKIYLSKISNLTK